MKFTKQTKLVLAILLIYLTTFAELTQLESTMRLNKKSKLKSNSNSLKKTSIRTATKTKQSQNPFFNFIIGTLEGLSANENRFKECFPSNWKEGASPASPISKPKAWTGFFPAGSLV